MDKRWSLQGMTALVTGGASGIGFVFLLCQIYISSSTEHPEWSKISMNL